MKMPDSVTVVQADDMAYPSWEETGPCCLDGWRMRDKIEMDEFVPVVELVSGRRFGSLLFDRALFVGRNRAKAARIYNRATAYLGYTEGNTRDAAAWAKRQHAKEAKTK